MNANVIEEGETEKTIFYISLAHLQINNGIISARIHEQIKNIIKVFDIDNFVEELGLDDAKDLSRRVESLEIEIQNVEVIG
ncbi:hypothetical protein [Paenibacillus pinisoli]|nr:hypothetical protein [Paenibacillus pinisoli]